MKYEELIGIETPLSFKYANHIMPEIVSLLKSYLFKNPDMVKYYLNNEIDVDELIKYIVNHQSLKDVINILDSDILAVINEYVEGVIWKL